MKVYLVERGYYSEYNIVCVCSTLEKAEQALVYYDADSIDERELDEFKQIQDGMLMWTVSMNRDGDSARANRAPNDCDEMQGEFVHRQSFLCRLWARDEEQAIKVANERRIMLLAAGKEKGP